LEAREVMRVLRLDPDAPRDLREKALLLAGRILDFDPALRGGRGTDRAREILDSGRALEAMQRIIEAQGPAKTTHELGPLTQDVAAPGDGVVTGIDCFRLARIARLAGAPMDKGAGIELFRKIGDQVRRGEALYRIYACFPADFRFATELAAEDHGYTLSLLP
jgi:thymidine phosphorylase